MKLLHQILLFLTLNSIIYCQTNPTKTVLIILGTRPEAIKIAPVYFALKQKNIKTHICSTGQHKELLDDVFETFNFKPDFDLQIMKQNQDLFQITAQIL